MGGGEWLNRDREVEFSRGGYPRGHWRSVRELHPGAAWTTANVSRSGGVVIPSVPENTPWGVLANAVFLFARDRIASDLVMIPRKKFERRKTIEDDENGSIELASSGVEGNRGESRKVN